MRIDLARQYDMFLEPDKFILHQFVNIGETDSFVRIMSVRLVRAREMVGVHLVRRLTEELIGPQVWGQVGVRLLDGQIRGFGEVTKGTG